MKKSINILILLVLIIVSCNNKDKQNIFDAKKPIDDSINIRKTLSEKKLLSEPSSININSFHKEADSLLSAFDKGASNYSLKTDTIDIQFKDKTSINFKYGIFNKILSDSLIHLVKHELFAPNIKKKLRIIIIQAHYSSNNVLDNKLQELSDSMNDKLNIVDGDSHINLGLSPHHDFIMISSKNLIWFNVSYTYNRSEFNKLIKVLENNTDTTEYRGVIKCYYGSVGKLISDFKSTPNSQ